MDVHWGWEAQAIDQQHLFEDALCLHLDELLDTISGGCDGCRQRQVALAMLFADGRQQLHKCLPHLVHVSFQQLMPLLLNIRRWI